MYEFFVNLCKVDSIVFLHTWNLFKDIKII